MKFLAAILLSASFTQVFASTFDCKAMGDKTATILEVTPQEATFGSLRLLRDNSYISGKNGRQFKRFSAGSFDLLVPTYMVKNQVNQGTILFFENGSKQTFTCLK